MRSPTAGQAGSLTRTLQREHGDVFDSLGASATKLVRCIRAMAEVGKLALEERPDDKPHAGRVIVDGVLQQAHRYTLQVAPAVRKILAYEEAASVSGFSDLVRRLGSKRVIGWKEGPVRDSLLVVADFFTAHNVDTYEEMVSWLEPMSNRDLLLNVTCGQKIGVFIPSNKTADYFRVLVHHWDAVAVDSAIIGFMEDCHLYEDWNRSFEYPEMRAIVQLAALGLKMLPVDLDWAIWEYKDKSKAAPPPPIGRPNFRETKYCWNCAEKISRVAKYCPNCRAEQP